MASSTVDQGFEIYGAHLLTKAAPYDPFSNTGGKDDDAYYMARPGVDFMRPWLAIEEDAAFQWPLGVEGFTLTTDPVLGTHSFIGDNKVVVDVIHTGAESLTLNGSFPGDSAPILMQSLREVVRRVAPNGKVLFVPELMTHAQRVQVSHSEFDRDSGGRGRTLSYTIDFQILGLAGKTGSPPFTAEDVQTTAPPKGNSARTVKVDSKHRTLRKVAQWKLGKSTLWEQIYRLSEAWFINNSVPKSQAPDKILPLGLTLYF